MAIVSSDSDTSHTTTDSPCHEANTRKQENDHGYCSPPPSLTTFPSVRASPEAESDDAAATDTDDSEDEAEWAAASAAAAAELKEEAKWEDAAPAESEDDVPAAEWEGDVPAAEWKDDVPAAESEDDADKGEPDSPPRGWPSNSGRRDPRKAELFRSLDAACEARRLQEARRRKRPQPPAGAGDPDEPIWPPKSRHWKRFRELSAPKSSPSNPVINPDENLLSLAQSNKSKEMLYDKAVDQGEDTKHSSESAPSHIVPYKNDHEGNPTLRLRELRAMKSIPANPVLNPDEDSLPSNKSKEILSDKVADQQDDTEHSSKSASSQIVLYKNSHGENPLPVLPKKIKYTIDTYAVQCGECRKWRLIPTKMKYDEIREKSRQEPFVCQHVHGWKPGVSCNDPADISQDDGFWVIDKKCISQTPLGWERRISIRSEGASKFADVYYILPRGKQSGGKKSRGKQLRSTKEVKKYLQDNPDYAASIQPSRDWFAVPARLQNHVKERPLQSKPLEPNEVLPLSCAPPIHEDLALNCVLALCDGGQ